MCGIVGIVAPRLEKKTRQGVLAGMLAQIRSRGPDGDGDWWSEEAYALGLGHRRLAIIDVSEAGTQPMQSHGGRFVLSYNGEIYNYRDLRLQLEAEGCVFQGSSDTEVLVNAFEAWGVRSAIERCVGMFAFAAYDREKRELVLGRDRLGIKPLYYGWTGSSFAFASECRCFKEIPDFTADLDPNALNHYLKRGYVPAPGCIYRGVYKLRPGCLLRVPISHQGNSPGKDAVHEEVYWSLGDAREIGKLGEGCAEDSQEEALDRLEGLLRDSVAGRMISDVPLGAFLSGGIDSSLVVALMQAQSQSKVRTFTIGFEASGFNEAEHAKRVAKHLGTEHTELYLAEREALEVVERMAEVYDEPFADSSQLPTYLLSRMTREHVTVALSGDGGDELFGGYRRYRFGEKLWRYREMVPGPLRRWGGAIAGDGDPLIRGWRNGAKLLAEPDFGAFYERLISRWKEPSGLLTEDFRGEEGIQANVESYPKGAGGSPMERMMAHDASAYLPDDILVKVDRASMAVGLEARVPLLDHRIVEFAFGLREEVRCGSKGGVQKPLLRALLSRSLPTELFERPKQGFSVPVSEWLRGGLRDWAEEHLSEERLRRDGILEVQPVRAAWTEHLQGRRDWSGYLWNLLMLQSWLSARRVR